MLVRPASGRAIEVLLLRRSQASHFVPDAYVFPGGTVDAQDAAASSLARLRGADEAWLRAQFRVRSAPDFATPFPAPATSDAAAITLAALRELYEEAGILLACNAGGRPAGLDEGASRTPFHELLAERDLYADARALALFSHWITPPHYPKRYNTFFFVAIAPRDQTASADAVETHDGIWLQPGAALQNFERGELQIVYPTIKHLERLAAFDDVDELMRFAAGKPIYSIMPHASPGAHFSMPPELERAW